MGTIIGALAIGALLLIFEEEIKKGGRALKRKLKGKKKDE